MIINSRDDLESLRGTAEYENALRIIAGAMISWELDKDKWIKRVDYTILDRFGFTKDAFEAEIAPLNLTEPVSPKVPDPEPAPSTDPKDYPLNKMQFETMLIFKGITLASLELAVDLLPVSAFQKATMKSQLRNGGANGMFRRDHPSVELIRKQINMPVAELDSLWMQAKDVT